MAQQSLVVETAIESDPSPPAEWPSTRAEFEALIERYKDPLARYALRRVGRVPDAEDVVQEVFLQAYRRLGDRGVRRPLAYLYRMASNACTDALRRRRRSAETLEGSAAETLADGRPGAREAIASLDDLARMEALLADLPRRQAEVIRMRIWDDLSFPEIAQVLRRSQATVKSRFRYGIEKLRTQVKREEVRS